MKTCKKCGLQHSRATCPECSRAYAKQRYLEKEKPRNAERYIKYRERYIAHRRQAYKNNPEKERTKNNEWKKKNAERLREYEANRYVTKTEYMKSKNKDWRDRNPKRRAENEARRRARIRENGCEKVDYAAIAARDQYICHICAVRVSEKELSFDHVIPLAKGGSHTAKNIKVAHRRCNSRKGTRIDFKEVTT